jgi:hypothetical protein
MAVTISVEPDELLGLTAVAELDEAATGRKPDMAEVVAALMHSALASKLDELGLPFLPLVVPIVLVPLAERWVSGQGTEPARGVPVSRAS